MSPFVQSMILILLILIFMALLNIDKNLADLGSFLKGMRWWK
jgi:hypothetical protein